MQAFEDWYHAYVIEGMPDAVLPELERFLAQQGIAIRGNPDYHARLAEQFLIDDAHALIAGARLRAVTDKKIFIHAFGFITHEAQNALLKLFEEPPLHTHFFLIVPTASLFLPTVLSRVRIVSMHASHTDTAAATDVERFLAAAKAKRLDAVKDMVADRLQAIRFLDELERYYVAHEKTPATLETLYRAKNYMRDRGASPKMLLEYLALMI